MKLYAQFSNGKIRPEYNTDYDKVGKLKPNTTYLVEITQPRNVGFHRKFFALLNLCYENQEQYNDFDDLRTDLTIAAGFFNIRTNHINGTKEVEAKSISFASMDDIQFEELYGMVMDEICKFLDLTNEDIQREVTNFM